MTEPAQFRLMVYEGNSTEAAVAYESPLDDWETYQRLKLPGFDGSYSLSLSGLWAQFHDSGYTPVKQTLTGYETIVKFDSTMQLEQDFRVTLELI